jgi:hypothetical protein
MSVTDHLECTDSVQIATRLRDGGEVVTPIWSVAVNGVPYVRAGYGKASK